MNDSDNESDDYFEEYELNDVSKKQAAESLLIKTQQLCTNLQKIVNHMISEANYNWQIQRKLARLRFPETHSLNSPKRNRMTVPVDAPTRVYFLPTYTIEEIVELYMEEEWMKDFLK